MHFNQTEFNLLAGLLAIIVISLALSRLTKKSSRYIAVPIMTTNELEFFGRLTRALGSRYFIFPQVAMSAIIRPEQSYQKNKAAYWNINKKRLDYVIYDPAMTLLCIVELDDKSHDIERDKVRDSWTESAGIKTIRWQSRAKPSEQRIRDAILGTS